MKHKHIMEAVCLILFLGYFWAQSAALLGVAVTAYWDSRYKMRNWHVNSQSSTAAKFAAWLVSRPGICFVLSAKTLWISTAKLEKALQFLLRILFVRSTTLARKYTEETDRNCIQGGPKKVIRKLLSISSPNVNRFSNEKFFTGTLCGKFL